jgi:beta-lactamase class A
MLADTREEGDTMEALVERLNAWSDEQPFHVGWSVEDLKTGWTASRNGDVVTPSASTRKVAILMAALRDVHQGHINLDERVPVDTSLDTTSGCFQWFSAGLEVAIRDLFLMMIIVSDNVSTRHVTGLVGLDRVQALCDELGMSGTAHRAQTPNYSLPRDHGPGVSNDTTPDDQRLLLRAIVDGAASEEAAARLGVTPALCELALDLMSKQRLRNRIPRHLPERTKVANKTGSLGGYLNDVGVVYAGGEPRYSFSYFTAGVPVTMPDGSAGHAVADHLAASMSRAIWDALGIE